MTNLDKYLAEIEGRYARNSLGAFNHSALFIHAHAGQDIAALVKMVRCASKALDTAIYDLERIRDADWVAEQMRMGARSGAHVANEAYADLNKLAGEVG